MQIFFNVHLIVDLCGLVLFQLYSKGAVKFCPFCSVMSKHVWFRVKLPTSLASHPFAQECSFAHGKKLFLLTETKLICQAYLKSLEWQHELFTTNNPAGCLRHLQTRLLLFDLAGFKTWGLKIHPFTTFWEPGAGPWRLCPIYIQYRISSFHRKKWNSESGASEFQSWVPCAASCCGQRVVSAVSAADALLEGGITAACLLWMLGLSSPAT